MRNTAVAFLRCDRRTGFHQHFEPDAETMRVQPLVAARPVTAPQVEIEDTHQLVGRRQRHQLTAILEATALNDPVKHLGLKSRDDMRDVRRVQNASEQTTRVSTASPGRTFAPPAGAIVARSAAHSFRTATTSTMNGFRHGNGDDNDPDAQQTVLNSGGN